MALWVCGGPGGCGTKYAVGLSRCPRCHNTAFYEDGDPMAKITRHGGASDDTVPAPEETPAVASEGGEESSPGPSSSASTKKPPTVSAPNETLDPLPVRTTANRSKKAPTDSDTAPSTGGEKTGPTSAPEAS